LAEFSKQEIDFGRKDVEHTIELVKQDLAAKEATAQKRKEEQERIRKESQNPKPAQKTAENSSDPIDSDESTTGNSSNPIHEDVKRLLELAPRLPEIITDMWNWSALLQGWQFVATATQNKYGARLTTLSRDVYGAYKKSKGSPERLQELIKTHTPLQVEQKNPPTTPPAANPAQIITPQGPNSGSNQTPQGERAPNGVPGGVESSKKIAPLTELDEFMKKTDRHLAAILSPDSTEIRAPVLDIS